MDFFLQDNVADFIRVGGVQKMLDGAFVLQVITSLITDIAVFLEPLKTYDLTL